MEMRKLKYKVRGCKQRNLETTFHNIACGNAGQRVHVTAPDFEDIKDIRARPSRKRTFAVIKGDRKMYDDTP